MEDLKFIRIPDLKMESEIERKLLGQCVVRLHKEVENLKAKVGQLSTDQGTKEDIIIDLVQRNHELERENQTLRELIINNDKSKQLGFMLAMAFNSKV